MLDVLEPSREVGDTATAETEAAEERNHAVSLISSCDAITGNQRENLLCGATRNKFNSRHLPDSTHWAVNWRGPLLQGDQRSGTGVGALRHGLLRILLLRHLLLGVLLLRELLLRHSLVRIGFLLAGLHAWLFAIRRRLWAGVLRRSHREECFSEILPFWWIGFSFERSLDVKLHVLLLGSSWELLLDLGLMYR